MIAVTGVVAAMAALRVDSMRTNAAFNAAHASLRDYARAALLYRDAHGAYPPDRGPGQFPPQFASYLNPKPFLSATPLGGNWDWNAPPASPWNTHGPNISIHITPRPAGLWETFDARFDDGSLSTGGLRLLNSNKNLCFMLEP